MARFIYLVKLDGGESNADYSQFMKNVSELGAIGTGNYLGITNPCLIGHHQNIETIFNLCILGIEEENKVNVEEITTETIRNENSLHRIYIGKIIKYFLKKNRKDYKNLQFDEDEL